jgi:hypothetical protein
MSDSACNNAQVIRRTMLWSSTASTRIAISEGGSEVKPPSVYIRGPSTDGKSV